MHQPTLYQVCYVTREMLSRVIRVGMGLGSGFILISANSIVELYHLIAQHFF